MLNYYHILSSEITTDAGVFRVALNADCEVYQGHFPGEPISPGVCNIQMIKECAEIVLQGGAVSRPHQERMHNLTTRDTVGAAPVVSMVRPGDRTSMCSETPTMLLSHIKQCRLTTLVTPQQHPEVEVRVAILSRSEDTITFRGTIGKGEEVYMELKGEMTSDR
ncbi:MAG: hypothetical protein SOT07_03685 [Paludibacteraceae bacterium]|nr:hypothetical protein [Paludibacteraceae bacterium]